MKTLIEKWAQITESTKDEYRYNPDDDANDLNDASDYKEYKKEWDNLEKEVAEINSKMAQKPVKEAEEGDDDAEPFSDDPEIKKTMAKSDEFIDKLNKAGERNAKIADTGASDNEDKREMKDDGKKCFVMKRILVYKPAYKGSDVRGIKFSDLENMENGTYEVDEYETKEFNSEVEAKYYVAKEIKDFGDKYDIGLNDFDRLENTMRVEHVYKRSKDSEKQIKVDEINGIPKVVKDADPNAFGFLYSKSEGSIETKDEDGTFITDKLKKTIFAEFIVYHATKPVMFDGGIDQLLKAWMEENVPGWKSDAEKERNQYTAALKNISAMQKEIQEEIKTALCNQLEAQIAKNSDEKIIEVLKPAFPKDSDEELLDKTAEDFEDMTPYKLRGLLFKFGVISKEELEDFKDLTADDINDMVASDTDDETLASDEEILAAAKKDQTKRSIDGYATRSDGEDGDEDLETKQTSTDRWSADDPDDYEGNQNRTGTWYR